MVPLGHPPSHNRVVLKVFTPLSTWLYSKFILCQSVVIYINDIYNTTRLCCSNKQPLSPILQLWVMHKSHSLLVKQPSTDCVAFGTGQNYACVHINAIGQAIRQDMSIAFSAIHRFTVGCDTTPAICGKVMKSTWVVWKFCHEVIQAFNCGAAYPHDSLSVDD